MIIITPISSIVKHHRHIGGSRLEKQW